MVEGARRRRGHGGRAPRAASLRPLVLLALALGIALAQEPSQLRSPATAPYGPVPLVRVIDGDTIVVASNLGPRTVRLLGVDAPELDSGDPFGLPAAAALSRMLGEGALLWLETDLAPEDLYGRLLAYVYVPDDTGAWSVSGVRATQVNLAMVEAGWATPLSIAPNTTYADLLEVSAAAARVAARGVWGEGPVDARGEESLTPTASRPPLRLFCALFNPPTPNDVGEWVSVLVEEPLDTRGYYLYDDGSKQTFRLPAGQQPAGEIRVRNEGQGVWNNSGDVVYLMRGDEVIDTWRYGPEEAVSGRVVCRK